MAEPPPPPPAPPPPPVVEAAPVAMPAAPAAAPPAKTWKDFVTLEGLADAYYQYNFTKDGSSLTGPAFRNFDTTSNSFSLGYMKLGVGAAIENVAFRADLGYGHVGSIINSNSIAFSPSSSVGIDGMSVAAPGAGLASGLYGTSSGASAFLVQQAFASVTWGMLTLDFGKFVTQAGAEVIESNKNWLYSRSLLFLGIPLVHTGARLSLKASDQFTLIGSVVNGWNNDPDNNAAKTFGLSANITASPALSIFINTYLGREFEGADMRFLADGVAAITLSDKAALNLNVDYLKQGDINFFGVAAMGHFVLADHAALNVRAEYIKDKGVYAGTAEPSIYEGTVGFSLPWAGHYELRPELRFDGSDKEIFNNGTTFKKNQFTGTLAALAYF